MVGLLTQNLLDAILQFDSMNTVASQMESPEDVLKHRLQFISELLSLCRSSVDCKDDPEQALVLYSAILDSILSSVLHGYIEVELLNIRFGFDGRLTPSNERIISSTRIARLLLSLLLPSPSSPLIELLVRFLCGETSHQKLLFPTLLHRINCNATAVSIATMQLFDALLRSQHPVVFRTLLPSLPPPAPLSSPAPSLLSRFAQQFHTPLPQIDRFLAKGAALCAPLVHSDVEHEFAVLQRYRQGRASSDAPSEGGLFIAVLLARVRMILRQSMEVNLEVTRLVATLAIVAPPALFEALFLQPGEASFCAELDKVGEKRECER